MIGTERPDGFAETVYGTANPAARLSATEPFRRARVRVLESIGARLY